MTKPVPAEFVTQVWQDIAASSESDAFLLSKQIENEQPALMAYLLAQRELHEDIINEEEMALIYYLGVVVWQMMKRWHKQLMRTSLKKIDQAEDENIAMLDELQQRSEAGMWVVTEAMLEIYPEPEVLRYIVEALIDTKNDPEEIDLSPEAEGLAFIILKTTLDALIRCRMK